jgi:hypothetical protein
MMSKELLKKIGIVGVSFGLVGSPLLFAAEHEGQESDAPEQQQPADPATPADPGEPGEPATPADPADPADPATPADDDEDVGIDEAGFLSSKEENQFFADDLTGQNIKSLVEDDEEIGTIDKVLLNEDGEVVAVTVSVGGFLGMGDKTVAIEWEALELSRDDDGDYVISASISQDEIENAEEFQADPDE